MRLLVYLAVPCALGLSACTNSRNPPPANFAKDDDTAGSSAASTGGSGDNASSSGGSGGNSAPGGAAGEGPFVSDTATSGNSGAGDNGGASANDTTTNSSDGPTMLPEVEMCPSDLLEQPPDFDAVCALDGNWGEGQALTLGKGGNEQLVAVTPDELTLVWFSPGSSVGQFSVADRETPDDDFGSPIAVAADVVLAASPDGLRLVTAERGPTLSTVSRSSRGEEFGEPSQGEFELLDADAEQNALLFGSVVFSEDDRTLYYTVTGFEDDEYPLRVSERNGDEAWPVGSPLSTCEFRAYGALIRTPTGVSSDGRTLFFEDAAAGGARAAWRETTSSDFEWFVDLGDIGRAQPNQSCDRLYYWDKTSSRVAVVERQ